MNAHVVTGALAVLSEHTLEGKMVFEVTCRDFDHWKRLPDVLSYRGVECVRTGWSSDTNRACYKQSHMVAYRMGK